MNKLKLIFFLSTIITLNIYTEESIETLISNSDLDGIIAHLEITNGLTTVRKNHYLELAKDRVKEREKDIQSWIPYKGQMFITLVGLQGIDITRNSILNIVGNRRLSVIKENSTLLNIMAQELETKLRTKSKQDIEFFIKDQLDKNIGIISYWLAAASFYISYLCFNKAKNYKKQFYHNAIAIRALLETAPVIDQK